MEYLFLYLSKVLDIIELGWVGGGFGRGWERREVKSSNIVVFGYRLDKRFCYKLFRNMLDVVCLLFYIEGIVVV